MTKDDVTAGHLRYDLGQMYCSECLMDPSGLGVRGSTLAICRGCLVLDAVERVYWLQRQRQQTARERGEG